MASSLSLFLILTLTCALTRPSYAQQPNPGAGPAPQAGAKPDIKTKFAQFTQKITNGLNQFKAQIQATLAGLMAKKMGGAPMTPAAGTAGGPYTVNTAPAANSGPLLFGSPRPRPTLTTSDVRNQQRQQYYGQVPPRRIGSSVARVNNPSRNQQSVASVGQEVQGVEGVVGSSGVSAKMEVNEATIGSVDQQVKKMMENIEKQIDNDGKPEKAKAMLQ